MNVPFVPGIEAAGTLAEVGPQCDVFAVGDRVAFVGFMSGVYAEYSCVPWQRVVPIPASVTASQAAASLMQAMTAHALTCSAAPVSRGDVVLVHAAAGGVGSYLVQLAKRRGATVPAAVSSTAKADVASRLGADHVFLHDETDVERRVDDISRGGVQIVFDGSGRDTFDLSLDVLRPTGQLVIYGLTTGPVPPFDINRLSGITGATSKGSLRLTWATLSDYTADRTDLSWRAADVLAWAADGSLVAPVAQVLPLGEAARAHELVGQRTHAGKIVLVP